MNLPPRYAETSTEAYTENIWTPKPTTWPASTLVFSPGADKQGPESTTYPIEYIDKCDPIDQSNPAEGMDTIFAPSTTQDTKPIPGGVADPTRSEADQRQGLQGHTRGDIELQLATINQYIHNKKLRPLEWTCCSCSKEQKYRENLEPLDRLRCQYPRCGVSDKGFRIYRVHTMCEQCTVFVDPCAPVTKKALKKKRDEVREVLRKIKKVYEDVDCLAAVDDKEAAEMATRVKDREAREEQERERQEEQNLAQVEMERQQRNEWEEEEDKDHDGDDSDTVSQYDKSEKITEQDDSWEKEARKQQLRGKNKVQKKRGFKALLGL